MRVSALLGYHIISDEGRRIGHVFDVRVKRRSGSSRRRADQQWQVEGLVVGERGFLDRIGVLTASEGPPRLNHDLLPWERVLEIDDAHRTVIVRDRD